MGSVGLLILGLWSGPVPADQTRPVREVMLRSMTGDPVEPQGTISGGDPDEPQGAAPPGATPSVGAFATSTTDQVIQISGALTQNWDRLCQAVLRLCWTLSRPSK